MNKISESEHRTKLGLTRILSHSGVILGLVGGLFYILSGVILWITKLDSTLVGMAMIALGVFIIISSLYGIKNQLVGGVLCIIIGILSLTTILMGIFPLLGAVFTILGGTILLVQMR